MDPRYPNGRCQTCGYGVDFEGVCVNVDCSSYGLLGTEIDGWAEPDADVLARLADLVAPALLPVLDIDRGQARRAARATIRTLMANGLIVETEKAHAEAVLTLTDRPYDEGVDDG